MVALVMRGDDIHQDGMFSYLSPEARVPQDHPLRPCGRWWAGPCGSSPGRAAPPSRRRSCCELCSSKGCTPSAASQRLLMEQLD